MIAEIIAIGDELVSGQRLDTNSQWLSMKLGELGIEPKFHCTVGDSMEAGVEAFRTAISRSEMVVTTGGIGPTKDDLTRHVLADVANVPLVFDESVEKHIQAIFRSYGREMPENNRIQAFFPNGASVIENPEGTAPGIDLKVGNSRVFCLPGVPYEMKQMWNDYVSQKLLATIGKHSIIRNHSIHCFGAGESQIELMLEGITDRNHIPRVGITASQATITLRIAATGTNTENCDQEIDEVSRKIRNLLGDLVFGTDGDTLADVVCRSLAKRDMTISVSDFGFGGDVGLALFHADSNNEVLASSKVLPISDFDTLVPERDLHVHESGDQGISVIISPIHSENEREWFTVYLRTEREFVSEQFRYSGHSGLRQARTVKQILNFIRLKLSSVSE